MHARMVIRAALKSLRVACGVVGDLGDEVFFAVLRDAITRAKREWSPKSHPDVTALLAAHIDASCERICGQIQVAISLKAGAKERRRKPKRRNKGEERGG
jgi:hypothetical protein